MVAAPLSFTGSLSAYESYDETTHIGTRFPNKSVQLSQLLNAPNSDELIKDLATLVSHRGVVFFTDQDIEIGQQKELGRRLGELSGKPSTSKLHVHPISEETPELGADVSVISSEGCVAIHVWFLLLLIRFGGNRGIARAGGSMRSERAAHGWHADITFEHVPSDYAVRIYVSSTGDHSDRSIRFSKCTLFPKVSLQPPKPGVY